MVRAHNINPQILTWARETAGLSSDEAARKIGLTNSTLLSAVEKLDELEHGVTAPTRNQLLKIASVYFRPLTPSYLDSPPTEGERGEDFRSLSDHMPARQAAMLDTLLRDIRARQARGHSVRKRDEERDAPLATRCSESPHIRSI